ncbi:superoxide dismutase [Alloactinosynnema sp. L-07]|uniref:superoxide dismutase n=1 Tax=Alloactinosynnema sp. L-07 TaxID=1653480 RepID=UPI0006B594EB|nr:superoxide dismutase [Alloactinosynnema sp. L-07]
MRVLAVALLALFALATPASATPSGTFEPYSPDAKAVTYDQVKVPVGSRATAIRFSTGRGTAVLLLVHGLLPNRHYGAHVHVKPCGPLPADAGPHFQNVPDPVQPSLDPAYANPRNEVWLDFTTDARGSAVAVSVNQWRFGGRPAKSLIIHDHHTHSDGTAGPRLGCLNKEF